MTKPKLEQGVDYERGFIDGMQKQMQSSVDKAVNRMTQPEQEPVAFICEFYADEGHPFVSFEPVTHGTNTPLYTTPPQRTWVGLTDEEIAEVALEVPMDAIRITEAKLKEKNDPIHQ